MLSPTAFSRPSPLISLPSSPPPFSFFPFFIEETQQKKPNLQSNEYDQETKTLPLPSSILPPLSQDSLSQVHLISAENDKLTLSLIEKNQEIEFLKGKIVILEEKLRSSESEIGRLGRLKGDLEECVSGWRKKFGEFEQIFLEKTDQCETSKIKLKKQEKLTESLQTKNTELQDLLKKNEKNFESLKLELEKTKTQSGYFESEFEKKTDEMESLRREFENFKQSQGFVLDQAKNEALKTIEEVHSTHQEIYHQKIALEKRLLDYLEEIRHLNEERFAESKLKKEGDLRILDLQAKIKDLELENDRLWQLNNETRREEGGRREEEGRREVGGKRREERTKEEGRRREEGRKREEGRREDERRREEGERREDGGRREERRKEEGGRREDARREEGSREVGGKREEGGERGGFSSSLFGSPQHQFKQDNLRDTRVRADQTMRSTLVGGIKNLEPNLINRNQDKYPSTEKISTDPVLPILQQKFLLIAAENARLHSIIRAYKKYWELGGRREEEGGRKEEGVREELGRKRDETWRMMEEGRGGRRMDVGENRWEEGWKREAERRWEEGVGKREEEERRREEGWREEGGRREEQRGRELGWEGGRREPLMDKENMMDVRKWNEGEKNSYFY